MFDFLGVPDPKRPGPPIGPEVRQRRFFDLTRRLARAGSAREPPVLLFEDLHWFDRASEEFIENLVVEHAPGNRRAASPKRSPSSGQRFRVYQGLLILRNHADPHARP